MTRPKCRLTDRQKLWLFLASSYAAAILIGVVLVLAIEHAQTCSAVPACPAPTKAAK